MANIKSEELLHYVWKHRLFPLCDLRTTDGKTVEVIQPGLQNNNSGPDFFNAQLKIDGQTWVGNVEIHLLSSDWFRHRHNMDSAYNNVVLHVVGKADAYIPYPDDESRNIPQLELPVPESVVRRYDDLIKSDQIPRCRAILPNEPELTIHNWLAALQIERLEEKTEKIRERLEQCEYSWEDAFFRTLARNFGTGVNGDAFELWAKTIPTSAMGKHRDNLFQIESLFFGTAGMLNESTEEKLRIIGQKGVDVNESIDYFSSLKKEFAFLRSKFSITPMNSAIFKFGRLRPQNFPTIRIAQLAMLYHKERINQSRIINAETVKDVYALLETDVSPFWQTHYNFTSDTSAESERKLSDSFKDLIIINTIVPMLFAYGKYRGDDKLQDRALNLLEQLKPEKNHIVANWEEAGIKCHSAGDSQALLQLTHNYCEVHDCLRCRFGYEYIKQTPTFLNED